MNTKQAVLVHCALAGIQAALQDIPADAIPPKYQLVYQAILMALHVIVAARNSRTDPKGQQLLDVGDGKFVSNVEKKVTPIR